MENYTLFCPGWATFCLYFSLIVRRFYKEWLVRSRQILPRRYCPLLTSHHSLPHPFGANITGGPVSAVEAVNANAAACRSADKIVISYVNTGVRNSRFIRCKKYQIPRKQFAAGDFCPQPVLLVRHARQRNAVMGKHILGKAGTVKSIRRIAAKDIGNADILIR